MSGRRDPARAEGPDEIWRDDVLLGTFQVDDDDDDMLWHFGRFDPTAAGRALEPHFEAVNSYLEADPHAPERARLEPGMKAAWLALWRLNLRFEGRRTDWFAEPIVLLVARGGRARFRPVSRPIGDRPVRPNRHGWWQWVFRRPWQVDSRETGR